VYVTDTTPSQSTQYRLLYAFGGTGENKDVLMNDDLTYTDTGTTSTLRIGCASHTGQFQLGDGSSHTVLFSPSNLS
jgi:hypothetical protein